MAQDTEAQSSGHRAQSSELRAMEKVKAIGEKIRNCKEFEELKTLFVPGSIGVTFYPQLREW